MLGVTEDYQARAHYQGCQQWQLFVIQSVGIFSIFIRDLLFPRFFREERVMKNACFYWTKFVLDFVLVVMTVLLSVTVWGHNIKVLPSILFVQLVVIVFLYSRQLKIPLGMAQWRQIIDAKIEMHQSPTRFLDYFRYGTLAFVGSAILAVDFRVFPIEFRKTSKYGHSLMDIGVAAFVYAAATGSQLSATRVQLNNSRKRSRIWLLPILALLRTAFIRIFNYGVDPREYGLHWQFCYTLVVIMVVAKRLPQSYPLTLGVLFSVLQQFILSKTERWILFGENKRENLLTANAEGLVSVTGYIALHYFASAVGQVIARQRHSIRSWTCCSLKLFVLSAIFYGIQRFCEVHFGPPARRLCTLAYVWSQMSLLTYCISLCLVIQMGIMLLWVSGANRFQTASPYDGSDPCLAVSINKAGLVFFLVNSILTGLVNLSMTTHDASDLEAMLILTTYMKIK